MGKKTTTTKEFLDKIDNPNRGDGDFDPFAIENNMKEYLSILLKEIERSLTNIEERPIVGEAITV